MSTAQLLQEKKTILHQIEKSTDEELLHEIYQMIEARNNNIENPLTHDEVLERAKKSEQDIINGNTITLSQLKEEVQKWQK